MYTQSKISTISTKTSSHHPPSSILLGFSKGVNPKTPSALKVFFFIHTVVQANVLHFDITQAQEWSLSFAEVCKILWLAANLSGIVATLRLLLL